MILFAFASILISTTKKKKKYSKIKYKKKSITPNTPIPTPSLQISPLSPLSA